MVEIAGLNPTIGSLLKIADALGVDLVVEFRSKKRSPSETDVMKQRIFDSDSLSDFLHDRKVEAKNFVYSLSAETLADENFNELSESILDRFRLNPIALDFDNLVIEDFGNREVDVRRHPRFTVFDDGPALYPDGVFYDIAIPFTGEAFLFNYKTQHTVQPPFEASVRENDIVVSIVEAILPEDKVGEKIAQIKNFLGGLVRHSASAVETFNRFLDDELIELLEKRKAESASRSRALEALGIKLKRRDDTPPVINSPQTRKVLNPKASARRKDESESEQEYFLQMEEYEEILVICSNMARVMELSPKAFQKIEEEDLRFHFLVQLNGRYEGKATGETFNVGGKTDIAIKENGVNIFIAECKYWSGPKNYSKAIDQLLDYISWRDTKIAIIVFNRDTGMTTVLKKIDDETQRHSNFVRSVEGYKHESGFRYMFRNKNDDRKEFLLTVLVFDVPKLN